MLTNDPIISIVCQSERHAMSEMQTVRRNNYCNLVIYDDKQYEHACILFRYMVNSTVCISCDVYTQSSITCNRDKVARAEYRLQSTVSARDKVENYSYNKGAFF